MIKLVLLILLNFHFQLIFATLQNKISKDEDVFNDPDFQNMSDSDLDDNLPLFENEETDYEDDNGSDDEKAQSKQLSA